mmetsp:Transcript_7872/g.23050  ORF Transcript_7872/g.23050 Transcript_7872/m.23050 type:complete len:158 (-) Transcript_7872:100-573(-)
MDPSDERLVKAEASLAKRYAEVEEIAGLAQRLGLAEEEEEEDGQEEEEGDEEGGGEEGEEEGGGEEEAFDEFDDFAEDEVDEVDEEEGWEAEGQPADSSSFQDLPHAEGRGTFAAASEAEAEVARLEAELSECQEELREARGSGEIAEMQLRQWGYR